MEIYFSALQTEKVDTIKLLIKKGVGKVPADGRHHFFHTIGSAAAIAFSELVSEGMDQKVASERVTTAAMNMMSELLLQREP